MSAERPPRPPRWAEALLKAVIPPGLHRDALLGDLEEDMRRHAGRVSGRAARLRHARQALAVSTRYLVRRLRSASPAAILPALAQDLRHAWRSLAQAPGFVLVTAATLALGVGATTAIFSVVDGVLLRPLPYAEPDRLVRLFYVTGGEERENHSEPEIHDLVREVRALDGVAAYREWAPVLGAADEPERVPVLLASEPLLPMLGVEPALGRLYGPDDDRPGAPGVVVLSHGFWQRAFGGDPAIVGREIVLEDRPVTVVGVMPDGFAYPRPEIEAWMPLRLDPADPWTRNNHYLQVTARLAEGVSVAEAQAELDALGARITAAYPDFYSGPVTFRPRLLRDYVVGDVQAPLVLLMAAVVGVLLIASVNAASLFVARGEGRRAEIAVRTALGAGRGRLAAQLLGESLLVAGLAGAAGVALAYAGVAGLKGLAPPELPRLEHVGIDARVLAFGLAVALGTGLLFGMVPAAQAWRADVRGVLGAGGHGGIGTRGSARFRRGLVVAQLTLATVLALGAGLLLRSFAELRAVELGFRPEGVLVVPLRPGASALRQDTAAAAWYPQLEARVAALPGVRAVGSAYRIPLVGGHDNYSVVLEGAESVTIGEAPSPGMQWATPGWFEAMGIELRRGRLFTDADHADAPPVAVVNERAAAELWPGQEALGKRIRMYNDAYPWMEVVGVVADVKHYGIRAEASTKLYIPHAQGYVTGYWSPAGLNLTIRTDGDPGALAGPVRNEVRELGPTIPIGEVRTLEAISASALARERFTLLLLAVFSGVALFLAAVGVYGVTAQAVASRTREIGLRMAVGAGRGEVTGGVLREALVMAAVGAALGLAGGLLASSLLESVLFGVSAADPLTYAAAVPVLVVVVVLAAAVPALRAGRMDPVVALRE